MIGFAFKAKDEDKVTAYLIFQKNNYLLASATSFRRM